jgi:hypothetical protein
MEVEETDARATGEVKRCSVVLPAVAEMKSKEGEVEEAVAEWLGAVYSVLR